LFVCDLGTALSFQEQREDERCGAICVG
jgi:hypothetical protein